MNEYFRSINGLKLAVCEQGTGFPVLWMHGLMMDMKADQAIGLAGFDGRYDHYRVIRCDAPGHGCSEGTLSAAGYQWSVLPRILTALADDRGVKAFVSSGFSMGSAAAIETAVQFPDRVKAVVLCMPPVIWEDRPAQCMAYSKMVQMAVRGNLLRFLPRLLRSTPTPVGFVEKGQPGTTDQVVREMCSIQPEYYAPILEGATRSDYPSRETLARVNIPVLIIGWENDPTHPVKSCYELMKVLPNAELHIASNYEEFLLLKQQVEDFLIRVVPD